MPKPQPKPKRRRWSDLSLVWQFASAGGVVMLVAAIAVGAFVQGRIEEAVVRNTANATALYMESFIAPLTQDLATQDRLSAASLEGIERLLTDTPLGQRVVSFKIWQKGGLVAGASDAALVGRHFEVTQNLRQAWQGVVRADFNDLGDNEDRAEHDLNLPLLEIYSPIRERGSGRVIAIAEFYEIATQLKADLSRARAMSWAAVALVMALIGVSLLAIVLRGSRTIDRQILALSDLSQHNVALRRRVQEAAARFSALNDQALRRIGADLHDGPAQLMGYAALRLDALRATLPTPEARAEMDGVARAVQDSMAEIRNISRGASLPDIDRRPVDEILQSLAESHRARTASPVQVNCRGSEGLDFSPALRICIYRFVQEGLNNAWRHGGGRGQEVRLAVQDGMLEVSVLDRGPGFASPPGEMVGPQAGLGLSGLTDRVESLGGRIEARNRDGGGAELRMTMEVRDGG